MNPIFAAIAAIPRIADSIESLAGMIGQLNKHLARVEAEKRKTRKDDEVNEAVDAIIARRDSDSVRDDG